MLFCPVDSVQSLLEGIFLSGGHNRYQNILDSSFSYAYTSFVMRRTGLLLMFFCGLFAAVKPATAQTWTQTSAPSNNNWVAVASSADGSKLIAAGMPCIYCISTNSGSTWITNTQPQKGSSYGSWFSIASSADGTKLVGISFNTIWASTNSGITWFSNSVPGVSAFISVTLSADGTKLVAVESLNTSPGSIYTSTNLGVTLTQTTAPTNFWTSVASSADGTKLVAAATTSTHGGPIYTSTNSGLTWALTGAPTNIGWQTVASSADGSKLLAGSAVSFTPGLGYGGIYTSTNFGITWTSNHVPAAQWQSVASSADGTKLVAVSIEPMGWIYTSTNSGTIWVSNNVPNNGWYSVASSSDGDKLVAAELAIYPSFTPGYIYTSQTTPSPQLTLTPKIGNYILSWIIPSTNFVMQYTCDLPATNWVTLTNTPTLNLTSLQNQVSFSPSISNSRSFYRLRSQ